MINYYQAVFSFMQKHKQPVMRSPHLVPVELAQFRVKLIEEELKELQLGIDNNDLVDIADALADLLYVTFGTAITYGLPMDSIFDEVHRSNMSKEKIRVEGNEMKVGKGIGYRPPKIKLLLDQCIRLIETNEN